ncbi:MAG TPA: hypothetical protein VGX96_18525 [Candidatus Elarobacter sp.]|jgi:hypothetical protein|nr:hypothetical protein [Candidatus Elarobacter sp.]
MGRQARCSARWGEHTGEVTVHLDSAELSARGAFRARTQLTALRDVRVDGDMLRMRAGDDAIELVLGCAAAARWAAALAKPAPTLAAKLGIAPGTPVLVDGAVDDEALAEALLLAMPAGKRDAEMVVARVDDIGALARLATVHRARLERGVPLWVVYTKGKGAPLGETVVIALLRERGLVDLKVASVSPALTALKFVRRARK